MKTARSVNLTKGIKHFAIGLSLILIGASSSQAVSSGFNQTGAGPYDYNTPGNWVSGINGLWDTSLTLGAAQTVTVAADTALTTGLTFNYGGSYALTLMASAAGTKTITLGGDIGLNTGGGTSANVTIGNASNHLNVDLGGVPRTITVAANRTLTFTDMVTNGAIVKAGSGTLTLNGANTYTNGTAVSAGTLIAGHTAAFGTTGAIILGDTNSGANAITLSLGGNAVSRPITVANQGTGMVTLGRGNFTGPITLNRKMAIGYSGGAASFKGGISGTGDVLLLVNGGWGVTFIDAANTFTGNVYIASGVELDLNNGGAQVLSYIPDASSVSVTGTLYNVNNGINETIDGLNGNGIVKGYNNRFTVGGNNGSGMFSGSIQNGAGPTGFTKAGSGTQTLSGISTYSGTTIITNGTLLVDGKLTGTGSVTVYNGGTLGGTGVVLGATSVVSGGTFSPGTPAANSGIGKCTVSNSVTFATGAIFAAQMTTNGIADQLYSSGTITNVNATLSLSLVDPNIRQETRFTIMAASNIVGTFNGLPEGTSLSVGGRRFAISYQGNTNVVLRALAAGTLIRFH